MKTNNKDKEIGNAIRKARKELGFTQKQFGEFFHVSENVVGNWETGKTPISASDITTFSLVFGVPIEEILGIGKEDKSDHETFIKLLDTFDSDNIYKKYYCLPKRSRQLVNKVISHELQYADIKRVEPKKSNSIYLAAANGTKDMNEEELDGVQAEIKKILEEED